jgi:hypothetical protein
VIAARRLLPPLALVAILFAIALDFWMRAEPIGIDFHTYEAAARVGLEQGWVHIYDQGPVAVEQKLLVPGEVAQPFISPPPVAWLAAALASLPYALSYLIWASVTLAVFVGALAWSAPSRGVVRWVVVAAAVAPWWVAEAIYVGQVVPLVAAGVAIAWRLLREDRNTAAGIVLSLLLLKPNTAFVVPFALLVAGRYRTFVTFSASAAVIAAAALLILGGDGIFDYLRELTGPLPAGADILTLEGALGVSGGVATALRVFIIATALVAAFRLRRSPGLVLVVGVLGSLITVPYLHASDLCLLAVAACIVWEERPALAWRLPLVAGWLLAGPYALIVKLSPHLNRWPLLELVFLAAMVAAAWQVDSARRRDKVRDAA